jgi:magnesium and cobalt transporter
VVLQRFGRVPKRGEQISFDNLTFKVLRADSRRLHLLQVMRKSDKK